ncbi:MAG: beta-lactamase family protein [Defluviitaleaceae bacterium]|nr:beta-lactamase family protein [Defluviitaleaceae bacterium]
MRQSIQNIFKDWLKNKNENFSGVFYASSVGDIKYQQTYGSRNKGEELPNTVDTAFAIASGTKLFTGLAICKLIDNKKLSLEDKLCDLLPFDLGKIDKRVTVFHLLTHTSGIGDYIDEDADDCEEQLQALYDKYPPHLWERLEYYLPMTTQLPPKFEPGERFCYSNSGFVLLGLIVEAVSGLSYRQFVQDKIIKPRKLVHTGFYRMDSLPTNTALGYIQNRDTKEWRTNIFSVPILGGSDGGLFTCAEDVDIIWRDLFANKILSKEMTQAFLAAQVVRGKNESYGLGVYRIDEGDKTIFYAVGVDNGVNFFTVYFPQPRIVVSAFDNTNTNLFSLLNDLLEKFHYPV